MTASLENTLDALARTLGAMPGLTRVASASEVVKAGPAKSGRRFVLRAPENPLAFRVARHFDLRVDGLLVDEELGSIGVLQVLEWPPRVPIANWARQQIDQATYLRHLLLEDLRPGSKQAGNSPYLVELVLVVPFDVVPRYQLAPANGGAPDCSAEIGSVLRLLLRESSILHAIGVSLWWPPGDGDISSPEARSRARRAFAWLLPDTQAWLADPRNCPRDSASDLGGFVEAIELDNFRVAGRRRLELATGQALHLVHGHNGSGKSAFCEALESVVTGTVSRVGRDDHALVLTNRGAREIGKMARVIVTRDGKSSTWAFSAAGTDQPPLGGAHEDALRLDDSVERRLTQGTGADRARLLLEAFFPEEGRNFLERDLAWSKVMDLLPKLPGRLQRRLGIEKPTDQPRLEASRIVGEFEWALSEPLSWERVCGLLPLDRSQLEALAGLVPPEIIEYFGRTGALTSEGAASALKACDVAFTELSTQLDSLIESLDQAAVILETFGTVALIEVAEESEELTVLMNQWLELHALVDLLQREQAIVASIRRARNEGHDFDRNRSLLLAEIEDGQDRGPMIAETRQRREELANRVARYVSPAERAAHAARRPDEPLPSLSKFDLHALDRCAKAGAFGPSWISARPGLGEAVRSAFETGRPVEVSADGTVLVRVGEPKWADTLLAADRRLRQALEVVSKIRGELPSSDRPLAALLPGLRAMCGEARAIVQLDEETTRHFQSVVTDDGQFSRALNEVLALLTPARWAYQDVKAKAEMFTAQRQFELEAERVLLKDGREIGIPAKLRLNTAELNTLAMAFFLLCAQRVANPLRMIVLDDPFQNMDELTVTTIARGLRRLLRLWKCLASAGDSARRDLCGWQILVLLHGEENVERIRNETPCAAYFLPWLSPHNDPATPIPIERQPSVLDDELQPLGQLLELLEG